MFANPQKIIKQFSVGWGWKVADFGCGAGAYVFPIAEAVGPSGVVYAIDKKEPCLSKIAHTADARDVENIVVLRGDISTAGGSTLDDASVHGAVVSNILFSIPDRRTAVREIVRTVRPKGRILVVEWIRHFGEAHDDNALSEARISPDETKALFGDAGCEYEREINAGEYHYGMIFKKNMSQSTNHPNTTNGYKFHH